MSIKERIKRLNRYLKGWIGYFHIADMKSHLKKLGSWMRRRLRMCVWKQWKRVRTRIRKLRGLGLSKKKAIQFGNSRKGYWRLSNTHQMHRALNNQYWAEQGLVNLITVYSKHR